MLELTDQLEILTKFQSGAEIQYCTKCPTVTTWMGLTPLGSLSHLFNFEKYYYRVKPKPPKYVSVLECEYSKGYEMACRLDEPKQGEFSKYVLQDPRKVKYLVIDKKGDHGKSCYMYDDISESEANRGLNDNCYVAKILILDK